MNLSSGGRASDCLHSLWTQVNDVLREPMEQSSACDEALAENAARGRLNIMAEQAIEAAWCGKTQKVLRLLRNGVNVNTADKQDRTLVWLAASNSKAETVKALLHNNADPNTSNRQLETPLSAATASESVETVMVLLEHGCLLDTVNRRGETALSIAAKSGSQKIGETIVRELLSHGANANIPDKLNRTPLFMAALYGRTRVVLALLEFNADPEILDSRGHSALDVAEIEKNIDIKRELEKILNSKHEQWNEDRRREIFKCLICFDENHNEEKNDVIASIPCGHRVCANCHESVKSNPTCPQCRQTIQSHTPQTLFPNSRKLFSQFCVEIP
jgi:hypothetical protein